MLFKTKLLLAGLLLLVPIITSCGRNKLFYPVKIKSSFGYIDYKGDLRIVPKYRRAEGYAYGLAPVQRHDGSLVYLNRSGTELEVPTDYGAVAKLDVFADGMARVVVQRRVGYIDTQLRWVIAPQFTRASRFSEGLAAVLDSDRQRASYIDKKGAEIFALNEVTAVGPMRAGFAYFVSSGRFGIVTKQGHITREPSYLYLASADPVSGLARALDDKTELFGFVDRRGHWIISPRYPNAEDFSGGFAAVFISSPSNNSSRANRYGYVDVRGKLRLPSRYLAAGPFREGFARVQTKRGHRYIDRQGQWLSPLIFSSAHNFYVGLAAAQQGGNNLYLDTSGTVVWSSR